MGKSFQKKLLRNKFSNRTEQAARASQPLQLIISRWTNRPEFAPWDKKDDVNAGLWPCGVSQAGKVFTSKHPGSYNRGRKRYRREHSERFKWRFSNRLSLHIFNERVSRSLRDPREDYRKLLSLVHLSHKALETNMVNRICKTCLDFSVNTKQWPFFRKY